jgi:two-component system nitrate/nitrite response regulator NarL
MAESFILGWNTTRCPGFSFDNVPTFADPTRSGPGNQGEPSMNVLIVSDVRLHREGLACLLEPVPTITVIGVVDVGGALRRPARRTVDVVLLDLLPPECINVLHRLRQLHRRVRVVAIGVREVESEVLACAAAGIDGYVPVNAATDDLS